MFEDTIVAISTPLGRSGLGVVRLSGPQAVRIASEFLHKKAAATTPPAAVEGASVPTPFVPYRPILCRVSDFEAQQDIDEAVVTFFQAPRSYTAEDLVEVSCHGAPVVLKRVVELAVAKGARLAEPGEFTLRAFMNGRIDLVQAEAIRDLIEAKTLYQAQVALGQIEGALSKKLKPIKRKLVDLIALLEAGIDFAEDDVPVADNKTVAAQMADVQQLLAEIERSFQFGHLVHEGLTLTILGRPNVGKSSLFNRLVEADRAIVTDIPGTTRDVITETAQICGIPLRLVDTAGVRTAQNLVEQLGVARTFEALAETDLALLVLDNTCDPAPEDFDLKEKLSATTHLVILNKIDVAPSPRPSLKALHHEDAIAVSALTGEGIEALRAKIFATLSGGDHFAQEPALLTNIRHHRLVKQSIESLQKAAASVNQALPHEIVLLDLYSALRGLDEMTGETTIEDVLENIFSNFCIGK